MLLQVNVDSAKSADDGNEFGTILAVLSKAFGCIDHDLLILNKQSSKS